MRRICVRTRRKVPKTAEQLRRHAAVAAALRYDVTLTDELHAEIVRRIQSGAGGYRCVENQSHTRSHWVIVIEGREMRVVYDKKRKCLVTFLPLTDIFEFPHEEAEEAL